MGGICQWSFRHKPRASQLRQVAGAPLAGNAAPRAKAAKISCARRAHFSGNAGSWISTARPGIARERIHKAQARVRRPAHKRVKRQLRRFAVLHPRFACRRCARFVIDQRAPLIVVFFDAVDASAQPQRRGRIRQIAGDFLFGGDKPPALPSPLGFFCAKESIFPNQRDFSKLAAAGLPRKPSSLARRKISRHSPSSAARPSVLPPEVAQNLVHHRAQPQARKIVAVVRFAQSQNAAREKQIRTRLQIVGPARAQRRRRRAKGARGRGRRQAGRGRGRRRGGKAADGNARRRHHFARDDDERTFAYRFARVARRLRDKNDARMASERARERGASRRQALGAGSQSERAPRRIRKRRRGQIGQKSRVRPQQNNRVKIGERRARERSENRARGLRRRRVDRREEALEKVGEPRDEIVAREIVAARLPRRPAASAQAAQNDSPGLVAREPAADCFALGGGQNPIQKIGERSLAARRVFSFQLEKPPRRGEVVRAVRAAVRQTAQRGALAVGIERRKKAACFYHRFEIGARVDGESRGGEAQNRLADDESRGAPTGGVAQNDSARRGAGAKPPRQRAIERDRRDARVRRHFFDRGKRGFGRADQRLGARETPIAAAPRCGRGRGRGSGAGGSNSSRHSSSKNDSRAARGGRATSKGAPLASMRSKKARANGGSSSGSPPTKTTARRLLWQKRASPRATRRAG